MRGFAIIPAKRASIQYTGPGNCNMTFKEYLSERKAGHDAAGDFVRLAIADQNMPDVTSWVELAAFMKPRQDSFDAIEVAKTIWKEYEVNLKKLHRTGGA